MRVSGFENLTPQEVETVNLDILPLVGEDEKVVKNGINNAALKLARSKGTTLESDVQKLVNTIASLLTKIQQIAEKVQNPDLE